MTGDVLEPYKREFEEKFEERKKRQIENLRDLTEATQIGAYDALRVFPRLLRPRDSTDPKDALGWSVIYLWYEATDCYIYGAFQSCILTCGATVERCLRLEYLTHRGEIPRNRLWTLGQCITECEGVIASSVLSDARGILEPRNNRAHALLEHADPQLSLIGGANRGIEWSSAGHYLIEPYQGDARNVISLTYKILKALYG